jgi:hypothetical protein
VSQAPRPNRETVVDNALMREIQQAEIDVSGKYEALTDAQTDFDVASLKYAALRDILEGRWKKSAYLIDVEWPDRVGPPEGRWKFIHKRLGQAVVEVLEDSPEREFELSTILEDLNRGGAQPANRSQGLSLRAVNAVVMKSNRIHKTKGGKYRLPPIPGDELSEELALLRDK